MIAGAVFTGGRSSRYGRDKCLEVFNGQRLVQIAYLKLKEVVSDVFIVGKDYGIGKFLPDLKPHMGPLYALLGLLKNLDEHNGVIVLPCDMPLVPVDLLKNIAMFSKEYDIVVPKHGNYYEPLVAYYSREICSEVEKLVASGVLSMKRLLSLDVRIKFITEVELRKYGDPEEIFINVNYPEDFQKLKN